MSRLLLSSTLVSLTEESFLNAQFMIHDNQQTAIETLERKGISDRHES